MRDIARDTVKFTFWTLVAIAWAALLFGFVYAMSGQDEGSMPGYTCNPGHHRTVKECP